MRLQDQVVKLTQRAVEDVIRAVEAIPEDKRDWSPAPHTRSAMSQLKELSQSPALLTRVIGGDIPERFRDHAEENRASGAQSEDFAGLAATLRSETAKICSLVSSVDDEELEREITLPFGGGMIITLADAIGLHHWNLTYHLGQINYIQTILGDMEMH